MDSSLLRARERLLAGDYAGAAEDAQQTPDDTEALKLLARAWFKQGDLQGARDAILRALQLNPNDPESYRLLAAILEAQGDHAGAVRALEQAARRDPRLKRLAEKARAGTRVEYPEVGDLGLADGWDSAPSRWPGRLSALGWFLAGALAVALSRRRR